MTYTFGETHQHTADIQQRINIAEARNQDLQANLRLQQLEEANARAQAAIQASEQRTAQAIAKQQEIHHTYPTHPNWKQHQTEANREIKEWNTKRRALAVASRTSREARAGLQGVAGVVAPSELSMPLRSDTGLAA